MGQNLLFFLKRKSGFRGLLDFFSNSAAAYSLQPLSKATLNSPLVRVRRGSDNGELDFTGKQIIDGTMLNWVNNGTSDLYNQRMYFDGASTYVDIPSIGMGVNDFEWTVDLLPMSLSNTIVFADGGRNSLRLEVDQIRIQSRATGSPSYLFPNTGLKLNENNNITVRRIGATLSVLINNVVVGTITNNDEFGVTTIGARNNLNHFLGSIYNVNINNQAVYSGHGNTNADWVDQIGSNNGTVFGSPDLYTGQGFDGFVRTWYSQDALLRHAQQATALNQPLIVENGELVTENGKPAIKFNGVDDSIGRGVPFSGLTNSLAWSVVIKYTPKRLSDSQTIFRNVETASDSRVHIITVGSTLSAGVGIGTGSATSFASHQTDLEVGTSYLIILTYDGANMYMEVNGVLSIGTTAPSMVGAANVPFRLMARTDNVWYNQAAMEDTLIFNSYFDANNRQKIRKFLL